MFNFFKRPTEVDVAWKLQLFNLLTQYSELSQALSTAIVLNTERMTILEARMAVLEEELNDSSKDCS